MNSVPHTNFIELGQHSSMELSIQPGKRAGQLVAKLDGELDLYASVSFANLVMKHLDEGIRVLVLDVEGLRYLDSSGVGAIIRLLQKARTTGAELRFVKLGGTPRKVLQMSNIITLLKQFATLDDALESLP